MRTPTLPTLAAAVITSAVLALSGCGSDTSDTNTAPAPAPTTTAAGDPTSMSGMDMGTTDEDAARSTQTDVETIAVRLEQVFFSSSYPKDLAGAIRAAKDDGLELSDGNSIGSYVYDPDDVEFKLCVENEGGAYAIYDTSPMSVRGSGDSGGCPT